MTETDARSVFAEARDRFVRTALLLSSLSIVGAGASRIPTWEVQAPVGWLVGTVNVGFLPIFGPLLIAFGYSYLYLTWRAVIRTAAALPKGAEVVDGPLGYELAGLQAAKDARTAASLAMFRIWCFVVPIVAYVILMTTYADFCAASSNPDEQARLCSASRRTLTLIVGADGVTGFRPHMASIQRNLRSRAEGQEPDERARLLSLAEHAPWIYPPWQTWLYLSGLAFLVYLACGAIRSNASDA